MIHFDVLGAPNLVGSGGAEVTRILRQPRRLALLAYLALARPRGFHRRDTLVALFWPELEEGRARHALGQAVYVLRRELGEGVVLSRGRAEIGLAQERVRCDAVLLEESLEQGSLEAAVELYRGDLLPGFFDSAAPAFERWLEEERELLRSRLHGALWSLSEQSEQSGDAERAVHWARRAVQHAPYDEPGVRRLMELLARLESGDVAIRAFEECADRLRHEYELEPSAETLALAAAIGAAADPTTVAPARRPSPDRVAVLPFAVRGTSEYPQLAEGLVDLLSQNLDGAGELSVVDPGAVLVLTRSDPPGAISPARGGAIAERLGAGKFVLGSAVGTNGRLRLGAALYVIDDEPRLLARVSAEGEAERMLEVVDDLTARLLAARASSPGARLARLAAQTAGSIAALKAYLEGERALRAGHFPDAVRAFRRAVREDPEFAVAYYRLSRSAGWTNDFEAALEAAAQAVRHAAPLPEHERLFLTAFRAAHWGELDEAERLFRRIVGIWPEDADAWFQLGEALFHHDPLRGGTLGASRYALERARALDPYHAESLNKLTLVAAREGNRAEVANLLCQMAPVGELPLRWRAIEAFLLGHSAEQEHVVGQLAQASDEEVLTSSYRVAALLRKLPEAEPITRLATEPHRPKGTRAHAHVLLAHLAAARGRLVVAREELSRASALCRAQGVVYRGLFAVLPFLPPDRRQLEAAREELRAWAPSSEPTDPGTSTLVRVHDAIGALLRRYLLGLLDCSLGEPDEADAHAAELESATGRAAATHVAEALASSVRAELARKSGDARHALRLLEEMPTPSLVGAINSPFLARSRERFVRAELLRELGREEEALRWYGSLHEHYGGHECVYHAPAHLRRAEIHEWRDELEEATLHYRLALALWRDCDPPLRPVVAGTERHLAALETSEPGGRGDS